MASRPLSRNFCATSTTRPNPLAELARFLFQKGDFSRTKTSVRPGAFLPKDGETSVFDIVGLDDPGIRAIGDAVGSERGKPPKGRGEFLMGDVVEVGLRFERDDQPPRHGNLLGWPSEGPELKARVKAIAVALAVKAELVLHDQRRTPDNA